MSIFAVNYLCREVLRDHAFRAAMKADPAKALASLDLTDEERKALIAGDVGALYRMGVNGFLMGYLARYEVCSLNVEIYNQRMRAVKVDELGQRSPERGAPSMRSSDSHRVGRRAEPAGVDPAVERPAQAGVNAPAFGSDVIADTLRTLDIPYIALTPGASYRGLHDSLVNYLGNSARQMLLCLHEESTVAIAHGYAKVTGRAMAAAVHANVGLFHATMALFNAWCDRIPMLVLGATGPVDAVERRPWIDWIHTARDQGALVRGYTSGTISRPRPAQRARRYCGGHGSPIPRRWDRST
jgi:hypothetical protein